MCYIVQFVSGSAFVSGLEVLTHIRSDHRTSPVESRQPQTLERGASRSATDVGHDNQFKNRDTGEFNPIFLDLAH